MPVTRIYVLSDDNQMCEEFKSEHGLSLLVCLSNGHHWLWDVGQSSLFRENAARFGLDLSRIHGLALSHGHYDHTDGLDVLYKQTGFAGPVFAHRSFLDMRYKMSETMTAPQSIGLKDGSLSWLQSGFTAVGGRCDLDEDLTMLSDIPRRGGFFQSVKGYSFDIEGKMPDHVPDDACLVAEAAGGPILILGCCHSGLANTFRHITDTMGLTRFHAVVGGLHLLNAPGAALSEVVSFCREYAVERLYPCHCTGSKAVSFLKENLPGIIFEIGTGSVIEF